MSFKQTLLLLLVGSSMACAPRNPPRGPIVLENDHEIRPAAAAPQQEIDIPRTRRGTISRDKLLTVLDAGVGGFLTQLEVEAYFEDRSFWGWKVQRYDNRWVDLLPGDIITSINGKRIETPAQVQALWQSLRGAEEIVVAAYRHENPFELRFTVQGVASAKAAPTMRKAAATEAPESTTEVSTPATQSPATAGSMSEKKGL